MRIPAGARVASGGSKDNKPALRSTRPLHPKGGIDGAHPHPPVHEMKRVRSGAAAEIEQHVSGPAQAVESPPHSLPLQLPDGGLSPQLVIPRRKRVKDPCCRCSAG